ncbi:MAG TPA: hypothetical protein VFS91_07615 [Nitrobacter sp.]|nr:hypothetical protein [Nitrobacter sp.]
MSTLDTGYNDDPVCAAIHAAEEVRDPLEGIVERTGTNPGAAFAPEVLERLAALKRHDRAAFEAVRAQLKNAGCRVTALDDAVSKESAEAGGRSPKQADILIGLAQTAELFRTPDGTGFADLDINGHRETWPIRAKGFRRWLARRFFEDTGGAPSSEALQSALNVIEAKAHFDAPERQVHVRVGGLDGRLYLDLGDETWRAVEIDAHRLACHRSARSLPSRIRHEAPAGPVARRLNRDLAIVPQRPDRRRFRSGGLVDVGLSPRSRSLSGDRPLWRAGFGEVHLFGNPADAA